MKKIAILFSVLFCQNIFAQNVAVNSNGSAPDVSAMLDVVSASKGLLIPRVALVSSIDAVTITTPANSLLVYNLGTGGLSPAGYYYNSGTTIAPVWVQLLNGGSPGTAWLLSGNTGTTAGTNFLGTTDAKDLVIKTTSAERMRILSTGNVGIGTSAPAQLLDVNGSSVIGRTASNATTAIGVIYDEGVIHHVGIYKRGSAAVGNMSLGAGSGEFLTNDGDLGIINASAAGYMAFGTGGVAAANERMRITAAGNVGIGTTSPITKLANTSVNTLDITGNGISANSIAWLTNTQGYVASLVNTDATVAGRNGLLIKTTATDASSFPLQINVGAANIITARGDGNVGIGTTTPAEKLTVFTAGSAAPFGVTSIDVGSFSTLANAQNSYFFRVRDVGAATTLFYLRGDGNVGIGTTAPSTKLHIVGTSGTTLKIVDGNQAAGKVLTSDANGVASWANPAAGTEVLLQNNEIGQSGTMYGVTTTTITCTIAGTFSKVKVEADIENDCTGGAAAGPQGWIYNILYNGLTVRSAALMGSGANWLEGHMTYMGTIANGQTISMTVTNNATVAGTWYIKNFRVWGIY